MTKTQRWWQFTQERFHPVSHLSMIAVFLVAHILVVQPVKPLAATLVNELVLLIGVITFYFKLRLYDEVKDYELDVVINKHRPLPRELLSHKDMYRGMAVCIFIELICFGSMGMNSFFTAVIAILYSLLMYKEFFIPEKIRPYLTTYAIVHTVVTTLLSFAIFSFLTQASLWDIITEPTLVFFAFANWLLFNIFEFGRKTYAEAEERRDVDTYSSLFGRSGAVILVASQALIAHFLGLTLKGVNQTFMLWSFGIMLVSLAVFSANYISKNTPEAASRYRAMTSLYIIIFYLILIIAHILA